MRFVLVGPVFPFRGGIAHYTTMLHRALRQRGHNVLLVSFKRQYPLWLFPGHSDRDPSAQPLEVDGARYWIDSLNPLTWLASFRHMRRFRPDTLVLQWWTTFWAPVWFVLGVLNRFLLRARLVYICHNVLPHEAHWFDPWLVRLVLSWGSRFIVQSASERDSLLTLLPRADVDVVPHPMYDMFADQRMSKEDARRRLGLPKGVPILLFFGIVREYKGLEDLLQALPSIRRSLAEVIVLVAGEFWDDKEKYLRIVERSGTRDRVMIIDRYIRNEEIGAYFSAADVVIAPYRRASGSGAVQLASGFKTPVIATDVCAADRDLLEEQGGLIVPPQAPEALAEAILRYFRREHPIQTDGPTAPDKGLSSWQDLVSCIEGVGADRAPWNGGIGS